MTADWVQALGGIVTAIIALYLLFQQQRDRRQDADAREREQARRVRLSRPTIGSIQSTMFEHGDYESSASSTLLNESDDVITGVKLRIEVRSNTAAPRIARTFVRDRLDPGEHLTGSLRFFINKYEGEVSNVVDMQSSAEFTDAAGIGWMRDESHRLLKRLRPPSGTGRRNGKGE